MKTIKIMLACIVIIPAAFWLWVCISLCNGRVEANKVMTRAFDENNGRRKCFTKISGKTI